MFVSFGKRRKGTRLPFGDQLRLIVRDGTSRFPPNSPKHVRCDWLPPGAWQPQLGPRASLHRVVAQLADGRCCRCIAQGAVLARASASTKARLHDPEPAYSGGFGAVRSGEIISVG